MLDVDRMKAHWFSNIGGRFSFISSLSLRAKATLGVLLPLLLILSLFTAIEYARYRAVLLSNLALFATYSAEVVEDNLLHQMLESDIEGVKHLLNVISAREEFQAVFIMDPTGTVILSPYDQNVGRQLDNREPECQPCHQLPPDERPESVVVTNESGQQVFRSMHPIENSPACAQCHDPDAKLLGLLLTDISMAPLSVPYANALRENLAWWLGSILVTVLVVNLMMSRFVLHRLERLAAAIAGFGHGGQSPPLVDNQPDEIGQLASAFNTMAKRIEKRRQENEVLSEQLQQQSALRGELLKRVITAQEDERKRVAREIHDQLGQTLSGLSLRSEVMGRIMGADQEYAREQLLEMQSLISDTSSQMYDIILDLRPSILDDLGLVPALRSYAERLLQPTDLQLDLEINAFHDRLPSEIETALFRTFQEALSNVVRHADATRLGLTLSFRNGVFQGEVSDDGIGFDLDSIQVDGSNSRGLGLLGMRERVEQCGGKLEICSSPGNGSRIKVHISLTEVNGG